MPNTKYAESVENYVHFRSIQIDERDEIPELLVHVILGASDYVKMKMQKCPRVGTINEPVAEQTKMGDTYYRPACHAAAVLDCGTECVRNKPQANQMPPRVATQSSIFVIEYCQIALKIAVKEIFLINYQTA